ncbi:hypothetical protein HMPREF1167_02239 [Aeromonas veronii AER39]|nr:hypothetical protein HMPREF1167_02239 [Aeromonas veronii AER39]
MFRFIFLCLSVAAENVSLLFLRLAQTLCSFALVIGRDRK